MIRNTLFSFFFFTGIVVISILFLPSLMFPQKIVLFGGKLFGYWSSFCLKFFLNTKINILLGIGGSGPTKRIPADKFKKFISAGNIV